MYLDFFHDFLRTHVVNFEDFVLPFDRWDTARTSYFLSGKAGFTWSYSLFKTLAVRYDPLSERELAWRATWHSCALLYAWS